jgi:hypothetical protein
LIFSWRNLAIFLTYSLNWGNFGNFRFSSVISTTFGFSGSPWLDGKESQKKKKKDKKTKKLFKKKKN